MNQIDNIYELIAWAILAALVAFVVWIIAKYI